MRGAMLAAVVWLGLGGVALGQNFVVQCVSRHQSVKMPYPVNWAATCRCEAAALAQDGYDPETFDQQLAQALGRLRPGGAGKGRQDRKAGKQAVIAAVTRAMAARGVALGRCLRASPGGAVAAPGVAGGTAGGLRPW